MTFASLFSGIGGWDCGMEQAGLQSLWFCELDKACQSVLRLHWKTQPIFGDINSVDFNQVEKPDVLCISAPCQAFSVAGLRGSLADDRGNLTLKSVEVANVLSPKIIVYENVPGILNTRDNAFGCFLAALVGADAPLVPPAECGWTDAGLVVGPKRTAAYRVLDSQYFGLAQRRRRVFVVADTLGGCSGQILFERQSSRRNPPARGKAGQGITRDVAPSLAASGRGTERCGESRGQNCVIPEVTGTMGARATAGGGFGGDFECAGGVIPDITHTLKGEGFDGSEDGTGRRTPLAVETMATLDTHEGDKWGCDQWVKSGKPIVESERITTQITSVGNFSNPRPGDPCHPLAAGAHAPAIAYRTSGNCGPFEQGDKTGALNTATDPNQNIVCIPLDLRNSQRDAEKMGGVNRQGIGVGEDGEPAGTVSASFAPGVAVSFQPGNLSRKAGANPSVDTFPTLGAATLGDQAPHVAFGLDGEHNGDEELVGPIKTASGGGGRRASVSFGMKVRRLSPTECARLQGFPDDWNGFLSDSAAYKQYGNAVSVPVIRWIARRIKHFLA